MLDPSDLDKISLTPASSNTDLTGPPALTPVPLEAGFNKTLLAPLLPIASCGIVLPPTIATLVTFLVAAATAFLIAVGTSAAFPEPIPTRPLRSPTTAVAAKRN
ncbi:ribosomal protein [Firmicutes bacterium CAG:822]|nr:ribosomal protein [Firmicutes bacterium CAG:822]